MLIEHRGEAEYDFRRFLHASYRSVVEADVGEALRLTRQLLRDTGTRLYAAVKGWEHPVSLESFLLASLYTAWTGDKHPLMPELSDQTLTDADTRLADLALEAMNRR